LNLTASTYLGLVLQVKQLERDNKNLRDELDKLKKTNKELEASQRGPCGGGEVVHSLDLDR